MELEALVGEEGGVAVVAAQAMLDPSRAGEAPAARLAIRPYPAELEEMIELRSGETVRMRPIRPEDARALQRAFTIMDPEDIRMRLFAPVSGLSDEMAARMTQVDYDREMAFVIEDPKNPGELWGGARVVADPDNVEAEFSVTVLSNLKGHGVGAVSLSRILDYAAARGIETVAPVWRAYTRTQLLEGRVPPDPWSRRVLVSFNRERGGDVEVLFEPYWLGGASGTSHGTPFSYDTHIPLIVMGPGIRGGRYDRAVVLNDLAPTLSTLLGIETPSGASGQPLAEILAQPPSPRP
jgi:GNAT superfamily N-acetyltransferase